MASAVEDALRKISSPTRCRPNEALELLYDLKREAAAMTTEPPASANSSSSSTRRRNARWRCASPRAAPSTPAAASRCCAPPSPAISSNGAAWKRSCGDEAHAEAEALLHNAAKTGERAAGIIPELVIPHGRNTDCLLELSSDDKDISILVLAAGTAKEGPGPLVSLFAGTSAQTIPVTIVPGSLSDEAIDTLA